MTVTETLAECFARLPAKKFARLQKYVEQGKHVLCGDEWDVFCRDGMG